MRKFVVLITLFFTILSVSVLGQAQRVDTLILEGIELHDAGEFEEAIDRYNQALELDSTHIFAMYELSLSHLALNDFEDALLYSTLVIDSDNEKLAPGAYAVMSEAL